MRWILRVLLVVCGAVGVIHLSPDPATSQVRVYDGTIEQRNVLDPWSAAVGLAVNSLSCQHCGESAYGVGGRIALVRRITDRTAIETALQGSTALLDGYVGRPVLVSFGFRAHLPDPWGGFAVASAGAGSVDRWKDGSWTRTSAPGGAALIGWEFEVNDRLDLGAYWGYTTYSVDGNSVSNKSYGLSAVFRLSPTARADKPPP